MGAQAFERPGEPSRSAGPGLRADMKRSQLDLPTLRSTILEILRLAKDPDCPHNKLVEVVARDPALSLKILHFANSARLSLATPVRTVSRAVAVLGTRAIRNLAICFAACDAVAEAQVGGLDLPAFFEASLRRAAAAELLARRLRLADPDEAFTAGLIQDFGVVALAMRSPHRATEWAPLRRELAAHRREAEAAIFGQTHDAVAAELAQLWALPPELADVMRFHHRLDSLPASSDPSLVQIASWAEVVADVYTAEDRFEALELASERLRLEARLTEDQATELIGQVPERVEDHASVLGLRVDRQMGLKESLLLRESNLQLVEMTLSYQEMTLQLERLLREKARVERELRLANARLERLADVDPLTEVGNRRRYERFLRQEVERCRLGAGPLSVLMLDADHFKSINDEFGHNFGDLVLQTIASMLASQTRPSDLVARVGGEEFAIVLPATPPTIGRAVAERLREAVAARRMTCGTRTVSVTLSIGGATLLPTAADATAAAIVSLTAQADQALYAAKGQGRNRVEWAAGSGARPVRPVPGARAS